MVVKQKATTFKRFFEQTSYFPFVGSILRSYDVMTYRLRDLATNIFSSRLLIFYIGHKQMDPWEKPVGHD
jgi:hypothetical protein